MSAIISVSQTITDTPNLLDKPISNLGSYTLSSSDFDSYYLGRTTWWGGRAFINYLNSQKYGGISQWTLPTAGTNPRTGYNQINEPLGQLFYTELGGAAYNPIPNNANFSNEQTYWHWLSTEYAPGPNYSWSFYTNDGSNFISTKDNLFYVWPLTPGQLTPVPLPAPLWLFGSGLITLLGFKKRKISK